MADLLRGVGRTTVLPRFRELTSGQVHEKAPGDLVTVVDREVEAALEPTLVELLPGSRFVGEEGVHEDPARLEGLDRGWVWVVDPLDGTANFVAGVERFALMVGLLHEGRTMAGWIHAPAAGWTARAERGAGAWLDGTRLPSSSPETAGLRPPRMASLRHLPPGWRDRVRTEARGFRFRTESGCAGWDYAGLLQGEWEALLYWRTHPWDHVPGALLVEEAGGVVARLDGAPYRAGDGRSGLLAAAGAVAWQAARTALPALPEDDPCSADSPPS